MKIYKKYINLIEDWNEVENLNNRTKIAACLVVIRNSLSVGNKDVKNTMRDTKHDKEKTFNKIIALMLEHCYNSITDEFIKKLLEPGNYNIWDKSYSDLIYFNKNIFQIIGPELKNTASGKYILDEINDVKIIYIGY